MATLKFGKVRCEAEAGRDVLGLLLDAGAQIGYICMAGSCGTCRVTVRSGGEHLGPPNDAERHRIHGGIGLQRLACQAECLGTGDVEVSQP
jgi:ferredoxin